MQGEGASSSNFWWRRWIEQSRSPMWIALPVAVAEHLELDVARVAEIFLHVDGVVAERRAGFGRGLAHQAFELFLARHDLHAAPAAARRRLDQDRVADLLRQALCFPDRLERSFRAGDERQAELGRGALGLDLVAHRPDMLGLGADPDDVVELDDLRELRVFGEEAVAGVDGVGVDHFGGRNDVGDVEVGIRSPAAGRCRRFRRQGGRASRRHRRSNGPRRS